MKFFQPEVHALISDNFTSGKAATSEIPFLYYFVALLYKIFGYHDFIYRLINTLIYLTGIYSLYRIFIKLKVNYIWSLTFSLLFFASPVLVYYGNNFLTDITALSFTCLAWNFFISYYQKSMLKYYWISMLFFFLAMSMKISAGISVVALFCIYIMDLLSIIKFKKDGKLFLNKFWQLLPFVFIFLIVGCWVYYAKIYNARNGCGYFSTYIIPLWKTPSSSIATVIKYIKNLWLNQYFHPYTLWFFLLAFFANIFLLRKNKAFLLALNLLLLIGAILYSILWFETYQNHDYYTINLYILLVFTALTFSETINRIFPKTISNIFIKTILLVFLIFNIYHTRKQIHDRYTGWWTEYPKFKDFHTITPYLRSIGVTRYDTVISIPDYSHHTLYLMNQPGWTECYGLNKDSASIAKSIERGAKYLIIASKEDIQSKPYLKPFISDSVGRYNNTYIFKLK
jgi:4-amino-4-deoxy-L-arabinose transferase-like glycosyltransferase